jgi:diguanylate cyclase (GGDEF)-like protein
VLREGLALVARLSARLPSATPAELFGSACTGFVELLGASRCSTWSENDEEEMVLRQVAVAAALAPQERAVLPPGREISRWLDGLSEGRGERLACAQTLLLAADGASRVRVLAVPIGQGAAFVLESLDPEPWVALHVEIVQIVAALADQAAHAARWAREELAQSATAGALRNLLEMGIHARSAIEAAKALASTAAQILDFPVACAYLVDEAGVIVEAVTVGSDDEHEGRLRRHLVGKLAAGSPVWRRTVEGSSAGPDLIGDTARHGVVRPGGVAQTLALRSMAAIPLLSSDGPLGLVLCGDHKPRDRWRAGDRELLARLSLEGTVVVDNARLREAERHEATHDALTGLLNRRALAEQLQSALGPPHSGAQCAVLLLDLDRFKEVNDHLGHQRGDELLIAVAGRLGAGLTDIDVLARLGGDEFAVLLGRDGTLERAEQVARALGGLLEAPFEVGEFVLHVDVSIGIACAPVHAQDGEGLLQRADTAMYKAKRSGSDYAVYGPELAAESAAELGLLGELRRALAERRELVLHYQPKVNLRSGDVTGVEALVRWCHPRHGMLAPDRFVPLAEETGIVRALTNWVVPEALAQLRRWRREGVDVPVSVNVSARDVTDEQFPERVAAWLVENDVPGDRLVVEVTEGTLMRDRSAASAALERLRALGVRVSLDDFGTGYSSLAYLEALPVDELKIDRQFLHLAGSRGAVVRAISSLGHALQMTVVAEGVETAEQANWLADMECDEAQGFHFSPPAPPDVLGRWLQRRSGGFTAMP